MKALKSIGQIIASLLYPHVYTLVIVLAIYYPLRWVMEFPVWGIVLYMSFGYWIVLGILAMVRSLVAFPFMWIAKNNIVALVISALTIVVDISMAIYLTWEELVEQGWLAIIVAVIASGIFISRIIESIILLCKIYLDEY